MGSIQVNYTLWYPSNDSLAVLNILVSVPEKSNFYIVAKEAEKIDPRFTIDDYVYFKPEGYFITSINGLSEDPGNDLFWYIYDMDKAPDTSNPPTKDYLTKNEDSTGLIWLETEAVSREV
ncbi:unnamed protein product [Timema podura]|uniref:Uncharacterized protein n=1 Tax=Timema podura TaxID=61482 RepID=A0ABN7NUE0_TIMPD|nr:unnamed protein product [Timema podura]